MWKATMNAFPCVDGIVGGEADESLPVVIDRLLCATPLDSVAGVSFRRGGEVVRNPNAPVIEDLDSLPLPAFDLDPSSRIASSPTCPISAGGKTPKIWS
jgi:radical SAM superfamily enzyme YgiQ (UPF0313 family)